MTSTYDDWRGRREAERSEAQSDPRSDGAPIGAVRLQLLLLERLKFLPNQRAVVEQPLQLSQPCEVHHDAGRWTAEFTRGAIADSFPDI